MNFFTKKNPNLKKKYIFFWSGMGKRGGRGVRGLY